MVAKIVLVEAAWFVPPHRLVFIGQDDEVADAPQQDGGGVVGSEKPLVNQVRGPIHLGLSRKMVLEDGLSLVEVLSFDVQEHITARAGRHKQASCPIGLHERGQVWQL
jgi:hypothetical protein